MNPLDPILDQPQSIDYTELDPTATYALANQDVRFSVDKNTDLLNLEWPWANECYARSIRLRITDPRDETLVPMVTRYYPGYQEVILGSEGMIVSKRLTVPFKSHFDRAVIWLLECQVEGDRLLRLEIDIDWGEPLTQRIVDGLLVAQRNPGEARGIYAQSNAERTCVFGNPYGRPDVIEIEAGDRARLVYHVLVNGMVEVPLLLTISDVGEQVAWNGFLALRDTERAYQLTVKAWEALVRSGRLWTPDAQLNHAVQAGKLATIYNVQRLRGGIAPSDRRLEHLPVLVESLDVSDRTESRNLLAHARRLAELSEGRLPVLFSLRPKEPLIDPEAALLQTNSAYIHSLYQHLQHHFDGELLTAHYPALQACTEALIRQRAFMEENGVELAQLGAILRRALALAVQQANDTDVVRWESEAAEAERVAVERELAVANTDAWALTDWLPVSTWQTPATQPWHFTDAWAGIALAGQAIWRGCGLRQQNGELHVAPTWPDEWRWWALLDLSIGDKPLSLLWDGVTLHATRLVHSPFPVQVHQRIRAIKADEHDFDLEFELRSEVEGVVERKIFKPQFTDAAVDAFREDTT